MQPRGFPGLPEGWVSQWETFPSADGSLQLFGVNHHLEKWTAPRALIVLHGLGEHGGRYLHFPHYLKDTVQSVYCLDHRGHGRSEGLRGHVDRFDLYVDDAVLAIKRLDEHLKRRFGKSELHLFAHSMGGLIALRAVLKHAELPLQSVAISSPLLGVKVELSLVKRAAARALARVWGKVHMNSDIDPSTVSHDPEVVQNYIQDRLVHKKGTPLLYVEMMGAIEDTMKRHGPIQFPIQAMLAGEDRIVNTQAALEFMENLEAKEKLTLTYPGYFHEIVNELGKDRVFEDLKKWIIQHQS